MMMILGITDEQTVCDACGRVELKNTVIIGEDGVEVGRYGSTCASKMLGGRKGVLKTARNIEEVRRHHLAANMKGARKAKASGDMESFAIFGREILTLVLHKEEKEALRALCAS